uniref:Integrase catalytic domain-containing protein n=1 Tax=Tanacetum cinerariifolium TaxID=118510 RepID=A0A699GRN1_TANCI|nr:hypothetical protein [Tanacetum cinerariifolium]
MNSDTAHMMAASKVSMLKPDEFEIWRMRIKQYIQMMDYALWDVIENDPTLLKTQIVEGVRTFMLVTYVEDKAQRRLEVKARSTMMMGIPNEHQLKFNFIKDAKSEWDVKLKYKHKNMAFVSLSNNNSTDETVNIAQIVNTVIGVSIVGTQVNTTNIDNLSDVVICAFLASQLSSPQHARRFLKKTNRKLTVNGIDTIGFDKSNVECYNFHKRRHFARECRALRCQDTNHKESTRRTVHLETPASTALVSCDGLGCYDWSDQAEEGPNYALMAYTSTSSDSKVLDDEDEEMNQSKSEQKKVKPSIPKIEFVKPKQPEKKARKTIKQIENPRQNTYRPRVVNVVQGNGVNVVKASACWVWKPKTKAIDHVSKYNSASITLKKFDYGNPQMDLQDKGVTDSGCSRHMTRNMSYLIDYKEFDEGYVAFGGALACFFAKSTSDESKLWHKRLGHLNFKTSNKLVKGNLVRGLPSKLFENVETCVSCQKGKQHRASCKTKTENLISLPLHLLHMDLFGLIFVKNLMKKMYCLVVIDDYSRFTWVFFLATQDETIGIFKSFIIRIENLIDHMVKVIRCDNETEFKNREINQFCKMNGILRQFSVAKTSQQNGVAERRNRTLIEAVRTMLADSKLLTAFLSEAADEGFFVGHSMNSKSFRVCNSRKRIVEENLHIRFSENKPNVVGSRPDWLFNIDALTRTINYEPIVADPKSSQDDGFQPSSDSGKKVDEDPSKRSECRDQEQDDNVNSTNNFNAASTNRVNVVSENISSELLFDPNMPALEDISTFNLSSDHEDDDEKADMNNMDTTIQIKVKNASTPIETQKPLLKYEDSEEVDVHMYRSMIGSLMYLTSSTPDIMFVVCAFARYQVNPKVSYFHVVKRIFSARNRFWLQIPQQKLNMWLLQVDVDKFVQVFLDKQLEGMSNHNRIYVPPSHTNRIFRNMIRVGKGFSRRETPLFLIMVVQAQEEMGKGSTNPTNPHHTPTIIQPLTFQPQQKQKPKKTKRTDTQVPQLSDPTENVTDEVVNKEMDDSLVRASTTVSNLEAMQDSGNINKTRFKATLKERSSQGTSSGGGPRYQETIGDTIAQTRSENISKFSNDSLLAGINTPRSNEDSLKLKELMELCTNLQNKVLNLENTKTTQALEIDILKRKLKHTKPKAKAKRIAFHEPEESTTITTVAIPKPKSHDKGKAKMIEEPMKLKKKDQIMLDEKVALKLQEKLQAEFDKEQRLARENAQKEEEEEEANIALIKSRDDVQAKIDADYQLVKRLQAEEQQELNDEEKATIFMQLLEKRRKFFAA